MTEDGDAGDSSGGTRSATTGGSESGGEAGSLDGEAGQAEQGGAAGRSSAGGSDNAGASSVSPNNGPCSYSVTGGATFPGSDAMFLCAGGSAIRQAMGMGKYSASFGAGSYVATGMGDNSNSACTVDSATPPKAGDTWTLGAAHKGNCSLFFQPASGGIMQWAVSDTAPDSGTVSIHFVSATMTHGMYKPEDVYYFFEIDVTATLQGQPSSIPGVAFKGHFTLTTLPIGS